MLCTHPLIIVSIVLCDALIRSTGFQFTDRYGKGGISMKLHCRRPFEVIRGPAILRGRKSREVLENIPPLVWTQGIKDPHVCRLLSMFPRPSVSL
ncbi:hypothetical protein V8E53_010606 [Lactarius tabidus]